ncbi:MAG: C4-type zinc ribbon domain-containing protein, partial [Actinomycetota bacterium]
GSNVNHLIDAGAWDGEDELADAVEERQEIVDDIKHVEQEVDALEQRVKEVDHLLHSGAVAAPRELKALQDEIASLQRRQRMLEDGEIELMERAEPLDKTIGELTERTGQLEGRVGELEGELAEAEAGVDAEIAEVEAARASLVADVPADMLDEYDALRGRMAGVAVAKLSGGTCGGCFLSLSAVEVDRIKKLPADAVINCEECGRILVR